MALENTSHVTCQRSFLAHNARDDIWQLLELRFASFDADGAGTITYKELEGDLAMVKFQHFGTLLL
jgi:hypothetical protein